MDDTSIHFRVFLNLAGIQDIKEVGKKAGEILQGVDRDGDGSISRQEWRDAWQNCASLRKFRHELNNDSLRAEMVAKYGKNGPEHIPLYAFGPKMSFYRLPLYPTNVDEREEGSEYQDKIQLLFP